MADFSTIETVDAGVQVDFTKSTLNSTPHRHFADLGYDSLHSTPKPKHSQNAHDVSHSKAKSGTKLREVDSSGETDDNMSNTSCESHTFKWTESISKVRDCILFKRFHFWRDGDKKSCPDMVVTLEEPRLEWDKKLDFLLSIIGFAVDLANVWRFPYLCYKNGGGVFLIPYTIMLVFGALPLFFMELSLGQFTKAGPISVWTKICPAMKGVGYCCVLISWYVSFYYNVIIGWTVYFIITTLTSGPLLPWQHCDNEWNTPRCYSLTSVISEVKTNRTVLDILASDNRSSPAQEFFERRVLQINKSTGFTDMGSLRPELVACCVVVFVMLYFSLFKGVKSSGKVVWVTATAPYIILTILLIRGLFLPGAVDGILYYLNPQLEKLAEPSVWIDAAVQVFFSIGVGFGVHLTYASFNKFHNNCYTDALLTCCVNSLTSFYSGFVIFTFLGYMAESMKKDIANVASEGYGLVFQVYPEAISTLPFAKFWCLLFFFMLVTLGLDSAMGGLEAVITGLMDEFNIRSVKREYFTAVVLVTSFLGSLINCTQGGGYTMYWFDNYSAGISLLCSALFEALAVKIYGIDRFCDDIERMIGFRPNWYWRICWNYISPIFLLIVVCCALYSMESLTFHDYQFPVWSTVLGWTLSMSSVAAIPVMIIAYWIQKLYFPDIRRKSSSVSNTIQAPEPTLQDASVFV